jgi:hypothetical protein
MQESLSDRPRSDNKFNAINEFGNYLTAIGPVKVKYIDQTGIRKQEANKEIRFGHCNFAVLV